jgi:hypothetical protein
MLGDTGQEAVGPLQYGAIPPAVHNEHYTDMTPDRDPEHLPLSADLREKFARELIDDLRVSALDAQAIAPKAPEVEKLRTALDSVPDVRTSATRSSVFLAPVLPPLQGVIELLRNELRQSRRQYVLTDQNPDQAPPAYRPAVAEYFEQLSKDYQAAPAEQSPSPTPSPKP